MKHDRIAVIDFGGQYAHLIATKIRRMQVLAEVCQPEDSNEKLSQYRGIVVSGSPSLSSAGEDSNYNKGLYDLDLPILGLCFGHQEIAKHYGGQVEHTGREWGLAELQIQGSHPLFQGLESSQQVWMSHFDTVVALGPDFVEIGHTKRTDGRFNQNAAIASDKHKRYGFQFHPEVDDTLHGDDMLRNFVVHICGCKPTWSIDDYVEHAIAQIRQQVGDNKVFLLASGGVDSTVAAKLLGDAIGSDKLHLLHIDNGLMRKDESQRVLDMFAKLGLDRNLHFVDASVDFLKRLENTIEPEAKRRIIGDTFIEVFQKQADLLGISNHLLGQGTIYPDTIETGGTSRSDTIKTHHNRVPIIEEMIQQGRVVEPLAQLYKVEVRNLGKRLKIPKQALWRHPFPGPGLGVRLLCNAGQPEQEGFDVIEPKLAEIGKRFSLQTLALPIRSVGVKADIRTFEHPVLISGQADFETLSQATSTLCAEVKGINRCIWNLDSDHPTPQQATPHKAGVTKERLDILRQADAIVMDALRQYELYDEIWQCPTVLVPLSFDGRQGELVVVRPIHSKRGMTARAAQLPTAMLDHLRRQILAIQGVSGLALDLTSKPPGTIEWE